MMLSLHKAHRERTGRMAGVPWGLLSHRLLLQAQEPFVKCICEVPVTVWVLLCLWRFALGAQAWPQ